MSSSGKKILVTSALPYANGRVHLGHLAGAYLPADIFVRWQRLKGNDVRFICGSDEHGVPITLTALKQKCTPQDVVDQFHKANGEAFAAADVKFDIWSRTSSPEHHVLTQSFFKRLHDKGYIEKHESKQWYSEKLKMFLPDRYVSGTCPICKTENARGGECESCGATFEDSELLNPRVAFEGDNSTPVLKTTAHWFIKLETLEGKLKEFIASHGDDSKAPWRANVQREATGWLKRGLQQRSITRDTTWGVKIPLSDAEVEGKAIFVWFDAPIGYVTFTQQLFAKEGNPDGWKDFWQSPECPIYNFIGKDNIWFHAIFWPAMLQAVNDTVLPGEKPYQLVHQVVANEFLNFGGEKGSKSKGNAVEIGAFVEKFGSEALRYYLTAIAPEGNDSNFTWSDFLQRYTGELANVIGNYINRVLTFTASKVDGKVPTVDQWTAHQAFHDETLTALSTTGALLDGLQFRNALNTILNVSRSGNVHWDTNAPWKSLKTDVPEAHRVIFVNLYRVAAIGLALRPFLPKTAALILGYLGLSDPFAPGSANLKPEDIVKSGATVAKPEILFRKIEASELPQDAQA